MRTAPARQFARSCPAAAARRTRAPPERGGCASLSRGGGEGGLGEAGARSRAGAAEWWGWGGQVRGRGGQLLVSPPGRSAACSARRAVPSAACRALAARLSRPALECVQGSGGSQSSVARARFSPLFHCSGPASHCSLVRCLAWPHDGTLCLLTDGDSPVSRDESPHAEAHGHGCRGQVTEPTPQPLTEYFQYQCSNHNDISAIEKLCARR
jgi:hypothetical protein